MDGHRPHDPGSTSTTLSQAWHEHHRYLLDGAYRMLGSVSDAEDVVQKAFARLVSVDLDRIEDPRAWLVVVVSRLCLDQLRSARHLASRARRQVQAETGPARFTVEPAEQHRVAERFIAAASGSDLDELMQLLDPDVVGETDTGGITPGPRQPIVGRVRVARSLSSTSGRAT